MVCEDSVAEALKRACLALALLVLFAGCVGGAGDALPASSSDGLDSGEASADTVEHGAVPELSYFENLSISFEGVLRSQALACAFPDGVEGACAVLWAPGYESAVQLEPRNYTHVHLTLRWNATSPGTNEMQFAVMNKTTAPDGSDLWYRLTPWAMGTSPLHLDADVESYDLDSDLYVVAWAGNAAAPPLWVWAHVDQPFHVEGVLTVSKVAES